ncbi:DDB1- and CUL4-associated factor 13-like [Pomacea canaliculata]|uniref:DDB1- and CUL4-associated factor 13-like n=1 Tax=Pomacea canaliculata TaxID=400727 RepID=UPI000D729654|nr:DDB1- and CUL4-associated factor 13-like [Pomacea canaliculata]
MKIKQIKVLCRNPDDYLRETKLDIHMLPRNRDPTQHPFQLEREYKRALNATKLERVYAKPFLAGLDGHSDGVHVLCKHPTSLSLLLSGAEDGEMICWNLAKRAVVKKVLAHDGAVNGLCIHRTGKHLYSCGFDQTIKKWDISPEGIISDMPATTLLGKCVYQSIDHHWFDDTFVTSGQTVDVWVDQKTEPHRSFAWGVESVHHVKFNPIETYLLGAAAHDRTIILYDMRGSAPLRKVLLKMRTNTLSWNPMEPMTFTAANEDYNLYTFDMRKLSMPLNIHMDHVSAVMDVDYAPSGREFVSAGYDKCLRIFQVDKSRSKEIYHTKRMQRVTCVRWSLDNRYIVSGSDEMNIRLWKAKASEKLGILKPREKAAMNYAEALKTQFAHLPQIRRISRHRHVPKMVYNASHQMREMKDKEKRKEARRKAHSKPGKEPEKKLVAGERE